MEMSVSADAAVIWINFALEEIAIILISQISDAHMFDVLTKKTKKKKWSKRVYFFFHRTGA